MHAYTQCLLTKCLSSYSMGCIQRHAYYPARRAVYAFSGRQGDNTVFRLDALAKALSVIATATWLGGWLGVRHTPVLYQNG